MPHALGSDGRQRLQKVGRGRWGSSCVGKQKTAGGAVSTHIAALGFSDHPNGQKSPREAGSSIRAKTVRKKL